MENIGITFSILIFGLYVIPKMFQRIGVASGIVAFLMGVIASIWFHDQLADPAFDVMATIGITTLFFLAGFEIELREIWKERRIITHHLVFSGFILALVTFLVITLLGLPFRPALLLALGIVTPSTGFILSSIPTLKLTDEQRFWIRTKSIATEIVALAILFFVLQTGSWKDFGIAMGSVVGLILFLPLLFRFAARLIVPYAPDSELAFFLVIAILAGFITYRLGAYYLVGSFIAGVSAQRFLKMFPNINYEESIRALKLVSGFFIPIYFFKAGTRVGVDTLTLEALILGLYLFLSVAPVRLLVVLIHRKFGLKESVQESLPVALAILPTLVFGLVIASLLRNKFGVDNVIFAGLIIYTILATLMPSFCIPREKPLIPLHLLPTRRKK